MSELKEHLFCDCDEMFLENGSPLSNDIRTYYLKSEADKVIAELEKENESLKYSVATLETDLAMSQRWRKCSEEMPEDGETVLVLLGRTPKTRGFFLTSLYVAGEWTYGEDPQGCKPTYWMPLPKAPEEGE